VSDEALKEGGCMANWLITERETVLEAMSLHPVYFIEI